MSSALARVITLKHLKDLTGERSFQRGQVYCVSGQVRSLVVRGNTLDATVCGTEDYVVRLVAGDEGLEHRCSCPVGAEGSFCKHGVAVALARLGANAKGGGTSKKGRESATESSLLVSLDGDYEPAPAVPLGVRDEIAAAWGLPLGERVTVCVGDANASGVTGLLEVLDPPNYPWDPRQPLRLRIAGFVFGSREIASWKREAPALRQAQGLGVAARASPTLGWTRAAGFRPTASFALVS